MSTQVPRVRFAPSPTGYLHIGGARTCLYNYFFAKSTGGKLILRIEDTDAERSKKEYEDMLIEDLKWLGIEFDEGPTEGGEFAPYKQSQRKKIYQDYANNLLESGHAFKCFCTDKELEEKKERAIAEGKDPHYDGTCYGLSSEEIEERIQKNIPHVIRFKVEKKVHQFNDRLRGTVTYPANMVGDFVLIRSNGLPTYNFCCVVDDALMKITHVIRGEDHLNNTLRQSMIFDALNFKMPEFLHVSLLVGKDRQKLSKRHGATSVEQYRTAGYLPEALINYLCHLGWSHPEEKEIFDMKEVVSVFNLDRFTKSAALYDTEKLDWVNSQHLRELSNEQIEKLVFSDNTKINDFNNFDILNLNQQWRLDFIDFFKDKSDKTSDFVHHFNDLFDDSIELNESLSEIYSWDTTKEIRSYLKEEISSLLESGTDFVSGENFSNWMTYIKKELKIKGKPLFMGVRSVLTGHDHGPDLSRLIPLTSLKTISSRLKKQS